jgi:hypothetical protein
MGNLKSSEIKKINDVLANLKIDQVINELLLENGLGEYKIEKFKVKPIESLKPAFIENLICPPGQIKVWVCKPSGYCVEECM